MGSQTVTNSPGKHLLLCGQGGGQRQRDTKRDRDRDTQRDRALVLGSKAIFLLSISFLRDFAVSLEEREVVVRNPFCARHSGAHL